MKISFKFTQAGSGSDIWTFNIAQQLRKYGIDTEVQVFPKHFQFYPYLLRPIGAAKTDADIIHTNSWTGIGFADGGKPHVTTEHLVVHDRHVKPFKSKAQSFFHQLVYQHEKMCFNSAAAITAVSQYTGKMVKEHFGLNAMTIQNGIDIEKFYIKKITKELHDRGKGKVKLLFVGNCNIRKGADLLPRIMHELGNKFVLFATAGLRNTRVNESENIIAIGTLDHSQLLDFYNYCDIFLFPTRMEGLSLTTLEAMACGMPIITTDCFSMPELVIDGKGGYLCEQDNVDLFIKQVLCCADSPSLRKDMGNYNRSRVEEKFSLEHMTKQYISLYESLL
jgi:glycosyltransferase involved in cell wall biosynthesis